MSIEVIQGSILDFEGDCIVNPANSHLRHGGGLAKIIEQAAVGDYDYAEIESVRNWYADHDSVLRKGLVPTGGAVTTRAGKLPYKAVIHAVGPVWGGGEYHERPLLISAHYSALRVACEQGYASLAFPAISCGIFGYPVERAAEAVAWLMNGPTPYYFHVDVSFYLPEQEHYDAYKVALHV